jgi:hypothetical protein
MDDPQFCDCEHPSSVFAAAEPDARLLATMPEFFCQRTPQFKNLAQRKQTVSSRPFSETFVSNSQFQAWEIGGAWLIRQQRATGCSSGGRHTLLIIISRREDGGGGAVKNEVAAGGGCSVVV